MSQELSLSVRGTLSLPYPLLHGPAWGPEQSWTVGLRPGTSNG